MMAKQSVTIEANANDEGHLYGSVGATEIVAALKRNEITVTTDQVRLKGPLKELGLYTVLIHLGQEVEGELKVWVVPTVTDEVPGQSRKEGLKWPRSSSIDCQPSRRPRSRPKSSTGNPRERGSRAGPVLGQYAAVPDVSDDVALVLRSDDFYDEAHRRLYDHMRAMHDEGRASTRPCWSSG